MCISISIGGYKCVHGWMDVCRYVIGTRMNCKRTTQRKCIVATTTTTIVKIYRFNKNELKEEETEKKTTIWYKNI